MKLHMGTVLYTFLEHFHTHYFNQLIQQLLAYNQDSRNYRILPKIIQVVRQLGLNPDCRVGLTFPQDPLPVNMSLSHCCHPS